MTNKEFDILSTNYVTAKIRYEASLSKSREDVLMALGRRWALDELVTELGLSEACEERYKYYMKMKGAEYNL